MPVGILGCVAIGLCNTICEQDNYHDLHFSLANDKPQAALMRLSFSVIWEP